MSQKRRAYYRGLIAEGLAMAYLICKGYHPIRWRYKTKVGEIDLICRKGKTLIIVEVKAHKSPQACHDALTPKSRERIHRAALQFQGRYRSAAELALRFDLIAVTSGYRIHHLKDAF